MAATQTVSDVKAASTSPVILTKRLLIRSNTLADAPDMARLGNNLKIAANLRNTFPSPYLLEHAKGWLDICAKEPGNHFAICEADGGAYIGSIGITRGNDVQSRTCEIGYWIGEDYWGRGYATEALLAFSKFCFESNPSVLRLEANLFSSNMASRKVLEKAGWTYEGTKRQAIEKNGQVLDLVLFSLLRHECIR
ncbi:gcn5-related n-acetyltransferase [Colletotrichum truncatum]|uniref:Gcn5-related n-acetyltransferase n=1 Tax=Colletotrichum truncatum TaxID=5467 RepID=A0ACC3Z5M4_COLTU|nr:gcn5-related n-acetyltransferase [Colletotrichum truncatum]KAF6795280.1 gcn5-related n-acetyltransferase [Colletotrichum truncatum]